jgi:hypothetical protein
MTYLKMRRKNLPIEKRRPRRKERKRQLQLIEWLLMKRCQYKLYFDLVEPSLINLSPSTVVISLLPQEDLHLLGSGALGSAGRGREAILLYHIPVDLGLGGLAVSLPPRGPVIPFIRSRK